MKGTVLLGSLLIYNSPAFGGSFFKWLPKTERFKWSQLKIPAEHQSVNSSTTPNYRIRLEEAGGGGYGDL